MKYIIMLCLMALLLSGCALKNDAAYQRDCQLSCLDANMSYESHKIIENNATYASLKCSCNQYIGVWS